MHLARADLLRALVALPAVTLPVALPAAAAAFQSDDKSFDFALPNGWTLGPDSQRSDPNHLFRVTASRGKGASLEMVVDMAPGKRITSSSLGTPEEAAAKLLEQSPDSKLLSAAQVPGSVKGSAYYDIRLSQPGGGTRAVKYGVQQDRRYALSIVTSANAGDDVKAEVESILTSYNVFPVNMICISQSNAGSTPVAGSCY